MSQDTIRVGIVGAGANTKLHHIPGLQAIDGVEVVSVCNRSRTSAQRVADEFGIPKIYDDADALIEADENDAIVIGTWPYRHCAFTLAALAADKHVLCEARMACNVDEAGQMLRAAQAQPTLITQVVPSPMTLEFDETIKQLINSGALGDVLAVELRAGSGFIDYDAPMHWRYDRELNGNNVMSLGIWYEALMRWIGPAAHVGAVGHTFVTERRGDSGTVHAIDIPDHLNVIGAMACGAQLQMQFSAVTGLAGEPEVFLYGSEATLCLRGETLLMGRRTDDALQEVPIDPARRGRWRVEAEFINAIRGREPVTLTTFADGVRYMAFTDAVAQSLKNHQLVNVAAYD